VQSQGEDAYALWGDPDTDEDTWKEHNPYDLVDRLQGTPVYLSCGDGQSGPLDADGTTDSIEAPLRRENEALAKRLRTLQPAATVHLYEPGTHNWGLLGARAARRLADAHRGARPLTPGFATPAGRRSRDTPDVRETRVAESGVGGEEGQQLAGKG
jgi:S-formylglutathione hydrolase FrmB